MEPLRAGDGGAVDNRGADRQRDFCGERCRITAVGMENDSANFQVGIV